MNETRLEIKRKVPIRGNTGVFQETLFCDVLKKLAWLAAAFAACFVSVEKKMRRQ